MRHYLCLALAQGVLPRGVFKRSRKTLLVGFARALRRLTPRDLGTFALTVHVAVVTVAADAHLHGAEPAVVQPVSLLAGPHAPHTQHWTKPRITGIKARQTCLYARASM